MTTFSEPGPDREGKSVRAPSVSTQSPNSSSLSRLAEIADHLAENSIASDLRQLAARVSEGRFFVACIGQFKRGKSTLLNAIAGQPILPAGVVPITSVPTVLRHGEQLTARILSGGDWQTIRADDLVSYVSEELNPENRKRVDGVEVFVPAPLLASGMCLVDTPGIGSVFAGNTETTKDFIPQIDAAILVVGADPPISGEELALIESVSVNVDAVLIVLNKIDRVSNAEREQASAFATRVLQQRIGKATGHIYEVSALNRLNGSSNDDDWDLLVRDLTRLASHSGWELTRSAAERGMERFSAALRRAIELRILALTEPIADSERRVASLRQTVSQAQQSLLDLGALFSAEQMRLSNTLLARRKEFLKRMLPIAIEEFKRESGAVTTSFGPGRRRELMAMAQMIARRHIMPWLQDEEEQAEALYGAITMRFVNLVNGLLQRISDEQPSDFSYLPKSIDPEQTFSTPARFVFHEMITIAKPASPLLYCGDAMMGVLRIRAWFQRAAEDFLEQLLDTNASRVQGDVEQRVVEGRSHLESDVRRLLHEVSSTTEAALSNARELIDIGTSAVQGELERLSKLRDELTTLGAVS
jgi:hypothetical protein